MFKKLIKFSISLNTFSTVLISNINLVDSINEIYYSDAVKKVNDVRAKIDAALENLAEISNGIDRYRDALNDNNDSTNYEFYKGEKSYIIYKSVNRGQKYHGCASNSFYAKSCIYKLFDEKIFLNPHYITDVSAKCYYVITSWAGNSWGDMGEWFTDNSVDKHEIYKYFGNDIFYIANLDQDKEKVELSGEIDMEKPNASIYMNLLLKSSEKSKPLIKIREYIKGHTGWVIFDWHLFKGTIFYAITDESKEKLQNIKQRIVDLKSEIKSEVDKLNNYNPESDRGNDNYESSHLKRILDNCEQVHNKALDFIKLKNNNHWIQKF